MVRIDKMSRDQLIVMGVEIVTNIVRGVPRHRWTKEHRRLYAVCMIKAQPFYKAKINSPR